MSAGHEAAELGRLAEELAKRWQALLTSLSTAGQSTPPPWVVGEPDDRGVCDGPSFRLRSGITLHTGWWPEEGARAWVDQGVTERMDLGDTLELISAITGASALLAGAPDPLGAPKDEHEPWCTGVHSAGGARLFCESAPIASPSGLWSVRRIGVGARQEVLIKSSRTLVPACADELAAAILTVADETEGSSSSRHESLGLSGDRRIVLPKWALEPLMGDITGHGTWLKPGTARVLAGDLRRKAGAR